MGCEGLQVTHDSQLLIAERDTFAQTVTTLLRDAPRAYRLAAEARALVRRTYDWNVVGERA